MKQLFKFAIALILGVVAVGFQSCGGDDDEPETATLALSQTAISLKKGETKSVTINGGNGDYNISVDDDFYINANVTGTEITIIGNYVGESVVNVSSGSSTKNLMVKVETEHPELNIPILKWGSSVSYITNKVSVSEQGDDFRGYKYIKVIGESPVWSDETYYFKDDKLIGVKSVERQIYNSVGTPILIMGERYKPTNKTYQGYNTYDWFEKPNDTRVRLCTSRYGNKYSMEVWYSTTDETIELLSDAF